MFSTFSKDFPFSKYFHGADVPFPLKCRGVRCKGKLQKEKGRKRGRKEKENELRGGFERWEREVQEKENCIW